MMYLIYYIKAGILKLEVRALKVKIINEKLKDFGLEFKVRRMNYDQIVVNYPKGDGLFTYKFDDVELISEGDVDDLLIKYPHLLKIRIHRGISIFFYKALVENLQEILGEDLRDINLLRDKYKEINKRGGWEKDILMVINEKYPISMIITGVSFKRSSYSFNSRVLQAEEFLDISTFEINKIEYQIKWRENLLARYGMAIEQVKGNKNSEKIKLLI